MSIALLDSHLSEEYWHLLLASKFLNFVNDQVHDLNDMH